MITEGRHTIVWAALKTCSKNISVFCVSTKYKSNFLILANLKLAHVSLFDKCLQEIYCNKNKRFANCRNVNNNWVKEYTNWDMHPLERQLQMGERDIQTG